MAIKMIRK